MSERLTWEKFKDWAFIAAMSFVGTGITAGVTFLWLINGNLNELNVKLQAVVTEQKFTNKTLEDHENRIRTLEQN